VPTLLTLTVNGRQHPVQADPSTPLLTILRDELGLKGAKPACGLEQCGACKVLVDGVALPSCKKSAAEFAGKQIVTLEGLTSDGSLHPAQTAFLELQAAQCGYCTAGFVVAAAALLEQNPHPTRADIQAGLGRHICRCGSYHRIIAAVERAAELSSTEPIAYPTLRTERAGDGTHPSDRGHATQYPLDTIDAWLSFRDKAITIFSGKVEIGQGIHTALAQIVAEELDVEIARIRIAPVDTDHSPDEGYTAGSNSVQGSGGNLRRAAASARQLLLAKAAAALDVPADRLLVHDGLVIDPVGEGQIDYWTLQGDQPFHQPLNPDARLKSPAAYTVVGAPAPRLDLPDKVLGHPRFVTDLALPGMAHARLVRPPEWGARLLTVDVETARSLPGLLAVVQDGDFLAVIAESEAQAAAAAEKLRAAARWSPPTPPPDEENLYTDLLVGPSGDLLVVDGATVDAPIPSLLSPTESAQSHRARYLRPFTMHGALGPSAAAALWDGARLTVWSHSQGPFQLRAALAQALKMDESAVRVIHGEGPGCYGHNGADDAGLDAALCALALPGRPVLLQWSREDEHRWEPYGPAMAVEMQASLDSRGRVVAWNHDVWSYTHSGRPRRMEGASNLLASWLKTDGLPRPPARPGRGVHGGSHRNADPIYAFANRRIVKHSVPDSPLRTSSLRGLGAYANVFAIESFMDELALAAGMDPVAFRLAHLDDERGKAVVQAAAELARWQPDGRSGGKGQGRGFGFARYKNEKCYAAVVADVQVEKESGIVRVEKLWIAADAGQIINPDGLRHQLEGGAVQATSWTLKEAVRYTPAGLVSVDWFSYPVLRLAEAPEVAVMLVNSGGTPALGAGEATVGPTAAAIANAIWAATGARLRQLPFTPDRLLAELGMD